MTVQYSYMYTKSQIINIELVILLHACTALWHVYKVTNFTFVIDNGVWNAIRSAQNAADKLMVGNACKQNSPMMHSWRGVGGAVCNMSLCREMYKDTDLSNGRVNVSRSIAVSHGLVKTNGTDWLRLFQCCECHVHGTMYKDQETKLVKQCWTQWVNKTANCNRLLVT